MSFLLRLLGAVITACTYMVLGGALILALLYVNSLMVGQNKAPLLLLIESVVFVTTLIMIGKDDE